MSDVPSEANTGFRITRNCRDLSFTTSQTAIARSVHLSCMATPLDGNSGAASTCHICVGWTGSLIHTTL